MESEKLTETEIQEISNPEKLEKKPLKEEIKDDFYEMMKIKPKPKITTNYRIKVNPGMSAKIPINVKVVDKTQEGLVDPISFLSKLNIGVVNKSSLGFDLPKIDKTKDFDIPIKEESSKKDEDNKDKIKQEKSQIHDDHYIRNVIKSETLIKIKQINTTKSKKYERITKTPEFKTKKETYADYQDIDSETMLGNTKLNERLPEIKPNILIKADSYYLYNREIFIDFINKLFLPYQQEILQQEKDIKAGKISISCDDYSKQDFTLLIHQKIVRDYINLYTPYRGLLLFHGLGSGKTCSSIAISEGLKNDKQVIVMTPASLRDNYIQELKKCGDLMYKKNQYWEFISTKSNPEYVKYLSALLHLSEEYITKKGGAWFVNNTKEPNYESEISLDEQAKKSLDEQIDKMIFHKYKFLSYNGLRNNSSEWLQLTQNNTINPFTNKVIIIDEAHNLISRIVNKLRIKSQTSLSSKMYNYLMSAENCKIILLSGTPIINYPNEISVLFNILRGYIQCFKFKITNTKSFTLSSFEKIFKSDEIYKFVDHIQYNAKTKELHIYKNPFGFINTSTEDNKQIKYNEDDNNIYSGEFLEKLKTILTNNSIKFIEDKEKNHIENYKALPDLFDDFKYLFLNDNDEIKNQEMFIRRIIGLTSYFRSAQEELMPSYNPEEGDFEVIEIPMSASQFVIYSEARAQERKIESNSKKKKLKKKNLVAGNDQLFDDNVSTYRIFSRAYCNFVFPKEIERPMPKTGEKIEDVLEKVNDSGDLDENVLETNNKEDIKKKVNEMDGNYEYEDLEDIDKAEKEIKDIGYQDRIQNALFELKKNSNKYLNKTYLQELSPKYLNILENIQDEEAFPGIHLLYSQFKTLEGIGIFKLVLEENILKDSNTLFIDLKLKKNGNGSFDLLIDPIIDKKIREESLNVKFFASYTGSETREEREVILNILNSNWNVVPQNIISTIKEYIPNVENNNNGEVIKLLMISSSGAEGISLKNVRYVHIMEPYWHPVRKNQVIGRARRICSHANLPPDLQFVKVFLYLMKFSESQEKSDDAIEIGKHDRSKYQKNTITGEYVMHTTDQYLNELSNRKEMITNKLLNIVKSSAIDCVIHSSDSSKEDIKCYSINSESKTFDTNLMYTSDYKLQEKDEAIKKNKKEIKVVYKPILLNKNKYIYDKNLILNTNKNTHYLYDYDLYKNKDKTLTKMGTFKLIENDIYSYELFSKDANQKTTSGKFKILETGKIVIIE